MPENRPRSAFLGGRQALVLTLVLLAQGALYYSAGGERIQPKEPLSAIPRHLPGWQMTQESEVEPDVQVVLKADDTLTRIYQADSSRWAVGLFVAYFKTQRAGQAPHSPKNCLPGSGWTQERTGSLEIAIPGEAQPIRINRYLVAKGAEKSLVLYWYQSGNRVVASEYAAKFWLVADSMRYHRSDTAIVRIQVPVVDNDIEGAVAAGTGFVRSVMPSIRQNLPS